MTDIRIFFTFIKNKGKNKVKQFYQMFVNFLLILGQTSVLEQNNEKSEVYLRWVVYGRIILQNNILVTSNSVFYVAL